MKLHLHNILFGYKEPLITHPLCVTFHSGTFNVLYGNNGCGKTTLIKTIARLLNPLGGKIYFEDVDAFKIDRVSFSCKIAFLFTSRPFLMNHTVYDLIALGRLPYTAWNGKLSSTDIDIILHYANILHLQDILKKSAHSISDGQLQKTLIARTLAQQTAIIVMDEPLSYLDYGSKKDILEILKSIAYEEKKTLILSSHDIHLSQLYADNVLLLHQKKWTFQPAQQIISDTLFQDFLNT